MPINEDEHFMKMALEQAKAGGAKDGAGEVGCVIVRKGKVVSAGYNESKIRHDPTAHAEIVALRKLGQTDRQIKFADCALYVTLQPCTMCASACIWSGIDRIVYGATRADVHSMYFDAVHIDADDLIADAYRSRISILGGILASECAALYYRPESQPPVEEQTNV